MAPPGLAADISCPSATEPEPRVVHIPVEREASASAGPINFAILRSRIHSGSPRAAAALRLRTPTPVLDVQARTPPAGASLGPRLARYVDRHRRNWLEATLAMVMGDLVREVDVVVIGGGPGGESAAFR